jgi:hypothetical protein
VKSKANADAVRVAVSQASQNLRQAQGALSGFVSSIELAYDIFVCSTRAADHRGYE